MKDKSLKNAVQHAEPYFWRHVKKTRNHWLWTASVGRSGHGLFLLPRWSPFRRVHAHRYSWMLHNGVLEDPTVQVRHQCKEPRCVNPKHLCLGSHTENMRDKVRDGTALLGEKHFAAKLTDELVIALRGAANNGVTYARLGRVFGISKRSVPDIVKRRTWRHVA